MPVTLLGNVSQQEGVISVSTIIPPQAAQETLTSPAVALHGADFWHLAGVKGEGMKIGIIDIGFLGFQDLMGLELPPEERVHALCFTDLGTLSTDIDDCEIDSAHGSAVTEAAYDIAPEATYYIANPALMGRPEASDNMDGVRRGGRHQPFGRLAMDRSRRWEFDNSDQPAEHCASRGGERHNLGQRSGQ